MRKPLILAVMFLAGCVLAEMPANVSDYTQTDAAYYVNDIRTEGHDSQGLGVTFAAATPDFSGFSGR